MLRQVARRDADMYEYTDTTLVAGRNMIALSLGGKANWNNSGLAGLTASLFYPDNCRVNAVASMVDLVGSYAAGRIAKSHAEKALAAALKYGTVSRAAFDAQNTGTLSKAIRAKSAAEIAEYALSPSLAIQSVNALSRAVSTIDIGNLVLTPERP
jgi:hypothetical protein